MTTLTTRQFFFRCLPTTCTLYIFPVCLLCFGCFWNWFQWYFVIIAFYCLMLKFFLIFNCLLYLEVPILWWHFNYYSYNYFIVSLVVFSLLSNSFSFHCFVRDGKKLYWKNFSIFAHGSWLISIFLLFYCCCRHFYLSVMPFLLCWIKINDDG